MYCGFLGKIVLLLIIHQTACYKGDNPCDPAWGQKCKDGDKCYYYVARCDGIEDCPDKTDEVGCEDYKCHYVDLQVKCSNNLCAWGQPCDGKDDCKDGSDELNCKNYTCAIHHVKCPDGRCVEQCDGIAGCENSIDEQNCTDYVCPEMKSKCQDGTCAEIKRCDGQIDCLSDGSDEKKCANYTCPEGEIKCSDNTCIWGKRCNGRAGCLDGSDERNCKECVDGAFFCSADETCIPAERQCDHEKDCSNYEDELTDCEGIPDRYMSDIAKYLGKTRNMK